MKQLLLTLKKTVKSHHQWNVKDFLAVSDHSPEWIGKVEDWEIRSFYSYDEKGKQVITALLENKVWKEPSVIALTAKQIYDRVKDADPATKVSLGVRKGLNVNNIEIRAYGKIISLCDSSNGYGVLNLERSGSLITVKDLLVVLHPDLMKRETSNDNDVMDMLIEVYRTPHSEILEYLNSFPVMCKNTEEPTGYPITEVTSHDGNIVLIYNQDVIIG